MADILLWKYLHLICLVYWLGGDLGTYIASRYLLDSSLSAQSRLVASRILISCDQGPRFAMPLILPTGLQMAFSMGVLAIPAVMMGLIWLIALLWLSVIIALHFSHGGPPEWLTKLDWGLRIGVCILTLGYGLSSLLVDTQLYADWASFKLVIYGITVLMGLCIRIKLKPLFAVFPNIINNKIDEHTNRSIDQAVMGARPYVMVIWGALLLAAAFGLHLI